MFAFEIDNDTDAPIDYTLAGTLGNYGCNSGVHSFSRGTAAQRAAPHLGRRRPAAMASAATSRIATDAATGRALDYHFRGQWFDNLSRVLEGIRPARPVCPSGTTTRRAPPRNM